MAAKQVQVIISPALGSTARFQVAHYDQTTLLWCGLSKEHGHRSLVVCCSFESLSFAEPGTLNPSEEPQQ